MFHFKIKYCYNFSVKYKGKIMGITVNLDKELVDEAKTYSAVESRSVPKQIEHWAKIGRIAETNPDLSYNIIRDILLGLEDIRSGHVEEYKPGSL